MKLIKIKYKCKNLSRYSQLEKKKREKQFKKDL